MQQYNAIKAKYPDAVLLFRVGDFYETFGEDAIKAARILGIVLTNVEAFVHPLVKQFDQEHLTMTPHWRRWIEPAPNF